MSSRTLAATLRAAGFRDVVRRQYGESAHAELQGLERHEQLPDFDSLSHILIMEASGRGGTAPECLNEPREWYLRDVEIT